MISLIEITKSKDHISESYRLLRLKSSKEYIGSVYLKHDNSIGINIIGGFGNVTNEVLQKVVNTFEPLPPSKSMRNSHFIVNVAIEDISLAESLKEFGGLEIQRTFLLP